MKSRPAAICLLIVLVFACLTATSGSPRAEEGTLAQRLACTPDVYHFCSSFIPNADAISKCLEHNFFKLNS
jgi:hypothetical protein